jgi:hypothetical protein
MFPFLFLISALLDTVAGLNSVGLNPIIKLANHGNAAYDSGSVPTRMLYLA